MSKSVKTQNNTDPFQVLSTIFDLTIRPWIEVINGIKSKTISFYNLALFTCLLQLLVIFRIDKWGWLKVAGFYFNEGILFYLYLVLISITPFFLWGLIEVALRKRLIKNLTKVFINAGLKTNLGKLPNFIFDKAIDESTRKMRLYRSHLTLKEFENAKSKLESALHIYIDEMKENRVKGTVDIIYGHSKLDEDFSLESIESKKKNSFVIGKTRSEIIECDLRKIPHLLVAGETGGGKSTYLRQLITSFYVNNSSYSFELIDLKGELEFQLFDNLPRINVRGTPVEALRSLARFDKKIIESRKKLYRANGCKDIDAFFKIPIEKRIIPDNLHKEALGGRHIIVIDEAFQVFLGGGELSLAQVKEAKRSAIKIAAQGRAVGVHIIVATQRPDRQSIPSLMKPNLIGKVCFRLGNNASSMTVLDNTKATDLPDVKGRAIWQSSAGASIVQTPNLPEDIADKILEKYRINKDSKLISSSEANKRRNENTDTVERIEAVSYEG